MPRPLNIDAMNYGELLELQKKIEAALAVREAQIGDVTAKMRAIAEQSGFTLAELFSRKPRFKPWPPYTPKDVGRKERQRGLKE